jgi:hypothetical protein
MAVFGSAGSDGFKAHCTQSYNLHNSTHNILFSDRVMGEVGVVYNPSHVLEEVDDAVNFVQQPEDLGAVQAGNGNSDDAHLRTMFLECPKTKKCRTLSLGMEASKRAPMATHCPGSSI